MYLPGRGGAAECVSYFTVDHPITQGSVARAKQDSQCMQTCSNQIHHQNTMHALSKYTILSTSYNTKYHLVSMHTTGSQIGSPAKFNELLKTTNQSTPPNSK